jgi:putative oxidoreductase
MNLILWVGQVLLAVLFVMTGAGKVFTSTETMAQTLNLSTALVRFIGVCELLGAIGLILPAAARIQPRLTVWAAIGLSTVMVLATAFHISRAEYSTAAGPVVILAIAAFVAYGRGVRHPIAPRAARPA